MRLPARVALGTMHGKEEAIAPPLASLGVALVVPKGLDTDRFGTFTGETPRAGSMIDAARAKARAAIEATGVPVGLASEGAYGPHPLMPFLAGGREVLLWLDTRNGQEIIETLIDDSPCYDHAEADSVETAEPFLKRIGFPDTAVILRPAKVPTGPVVKGIRDHLHLAEAIKSVASAGTALLQTDMRAHLNLRRMTMIAALARRLASRLARPCGKCGAPGWGPLRPGPGLPCADCGTISLQPGGEIHGCTACGHHCLLPRKDGATQADPSLCPLCNP